MMLVMVNGIIDVRQRRHEDYRYRQQNHRCYQSAYHLETDFFLSENA
jgi:hypothetical protein